MHTLKTHTRRRPADPHVCPHADDHYVLNTGDITGQDASPPPPSLPQAPPPAPAPPPPDPLNNLYELDEHFEEDFEALTYGIASHK